MRNKYSKAAKANLGFKAKITRQLDFIYYEWYNNMKRKYDEWSL